MERNSVMVVCDSYYLSIKGVDSSSRSPSPNRSLKGFNLFRAISQKIGRGIRQSKQYKSTSSDDDEDSCSWLNNSTPGTLKKVQSLGQDEDSKCEFDLFYKTNERGILVNDKNYSLNSEKDDKNLNFRQNKKCLQFSDICRHHHYSSGSDTCSSNDDSSESNDVEGKAKRSSASSSSSAESFKPNNPALCKKFKALNLNSKSLSCFSLLQLKEESPDGRSSFSKEKRVKKSPQKILRKPATHTYIKGISGLPTVKVPIVNGSGL